VSCCRFGDISEAGRVARLVLNEHWSDESLASFRRELGFGASRVRLADLAWQVGENDELILGEERRARGARRGQTGACRCW
jgi:hypothetical protein